MRKLLIVAAVSGLVGFIAGNAFWYLASPLWIDVEVAEPISQSQAGDVLASGTFGGADSLHDGQGTATVYLGAGGDRILRFTDFEVANGPDLNVWLSAAPAVAESADVSGADYVALGRLKGNIGDQNYAVPGDVDLSAYPTVVVWCEQFSVLFASAPLR